MQKLDPDPIRDPVSFAKMDPIRIRKKTSDPIRIRCHLWYATTIQCCQILTSAFPQQGSKISPIP